MPDSHWGAQLPRLGGSGPGGSVSHRESVGTLSVVSVTAMAAGALITEMGGLAWNQNWIANYETSCRDDPSAGPGHSALDWGVPPIVLVATRFAPAGAFADETAASPND